MKLLLIFAICFVTSQPTGQLLLDRLQTTRDWIERSQSYGKMLYAFSDNVTTATVGHGVNGVGLYQPRDHALEYDSVLFVLQAILGFNPVSLSAKFDPYTIEWLGVDRVKVYYFADDKAGWNGAGYDLIADNFRYVEYIDFLPGSKLITLGYTYPEPAESIFFQVIASATAPEALCGLISAACAGTPYANDTQGMSSFPECLQFIYALGPDSANKCPYKITGNTIACRQTHGTLALLDPHTHCNHVAKVSPKCYDQCYPSCSNCDANAECVATPVPSTITIDYNCVCKSGYKGNGTSCVAQTCSTTNQCQMDAKTGSCQSGLCKCSNTFTWNPTTGKCDCLSPSKKFWTGTGQNSVPKCISLGRCDEHYQCSQKWNEVKCRSVGINPFVEKACLCNRGFNAGVEFDCVCSPGGVRKWSDLDDGDVCLHGSECVENYHCTYPKVCTGGNTTVFGTCT